MFFFCKQKTAYEMRISDWSSDVCSSDLGGEGIDKARSERPRPIVYMTGAVLVAILALTPWVGTFLAMVLAAVVIPLLWGERRYGILTAFAIGLPLIVLFVFAVLLDVNLVPGITGDLFGS